MKNTLEGINNRITEAEERISELEKKTKNERKKIELWFKLTFHVNILFTY